MNEANIKYVRTYQFLGEGFLLYFLLIPIYLLTDNPIPFWSYLFLLLATKVFLTILLSFTTTYIPFILYVPIAAFMLIAFFHYPVFIGIPLPFVLAWRYALHEQGVGMESERPLLFTTLLLLIIDTLFIQAISLYIMALLQFIVLIFGYLASNVIPVTKEDKGVLPTFYVLFGIFLAITFVVTMLFETISSGFFAVSSAIVSALSYIVLSFVKLLGLMGLNMESAQDWFASSGMENSSMMQALQQVSQGEDRSKEAASEYSDKVVESTYWGIIAVVVVVIVIIGIYLLNRKLKRERLDEEEEEGLTYGKVSGESKNPFKKNFFSRFTNKPNEPVRQLFFDFEAFAHKKGFGRKQSETIEDWFERLDVPYADVALYQKVRYGEETLTEDEVKRFKEDLSRLRNALSNKSQ